MPAQKYALVTTTIFVPKVLDAYAEDVKKHGRDTLFVVIGDKKTPEETAAYCADLARRTDVEVQYFSPARQEEYLARFPELGEHIQWNCIQRRNIGMLYAYEQGCEVIATIDDDNYLVTPDYFGAHKIGEEISCTEVKSSTGWMNVCRALEEKHERKFYHRGFPLEKRLPGEVWTEKQKTAAPVVSAGLWLGDPDVDALERIYYLADPTEATKLARPDRISPAKDTWTPFNSQNTAFARETIPAYFLSPKIGRYDDIWPSYVLRKIADHLNGSIVFGEPLVRQDRNPHNYWRDLDMERYGHSLTLTLVETLASISLSGTDYRTCYAELVEKLPAALSARTDLKLKDDERAFFEGYFTGMRIWSDVFSKLA